MPSVHSTGGYSACYQRKNVILSITWLPTLRHTTETCLHDELVQYGTNVTRITNHFLTGFKTHSMILKPIPNTGKMDKSLRLHRSWLKGNPTAVLLLKEHSNQMTPNDILSYTHRSVPCSTHTSNSILLLLLYLLQ